MNEICIPLDTIPEGTRADVKIHLHDTGKEIHFRLECLKLEELGEKENPEHRVNQIREFINTYSDRWELLQILDTPKGCGYVQLLYREHS